jgi:hypothetical protein
MPKKYSFFSTAAFFMVVSKDGTLVVPLNLIDVSVIGVTRGRYRLVSTCLRSDGVRRSELKNRVDLKESLCELADVLANLAGVQS